MVYGAETWATTKRHDDDATMDLRIHTQRQDQELTHPRNNKSGPGFHKDHREKIELVRACDEERWRTHTEESVEGGYTREKEERTTENKMERRVSTRFETFWTEETERAIWRRKIISYTGDPT